MRTRRRNAPEVGRTGARFPRVPDPGQPQRGPSSVGLPDRADDGVDHHAISATSAAADLLPRRDRSAIGSTGARFQRRENPSGLSPDDMTPATTPAAGLTTVWVPRTVSRLLTSASVVAQAQRPLAIADQHDRSLWLSASSTSCSDAC